jgi:hypothetical protein
MSLVTRGVHQSIDDRKDSAPVGERASPEAGDCQGDLANVKESQVRVMGVIANRQNGCYMGFKQ